MKLKKKIPLIDQHDRNGFWGGKFGGSFIPETLKKPIEDLTREFSKLRNNKTTKRIRQLIKIFKFNKLYDLIISLKTSNLKN